MTNSAVRWEYTAYWPSQDDKLELQAILRKLNEMGEDGWELISVNAHNGSWLQSACYIFKRPKGAK